MVNQIKHLVNNLDKPNNILKLEKLINCKLTNKLLICMILSEKDLPDIDNIIKILNRRIHINYEILLLNNLGYEYLINLPNIHIINSVTKNSPTLLNRYTLMCESLKYDYDYLWFIDPDDEIFDINDMHHYQDDLIIFNFDVCYDYYTRVTTYTENYWNFNFKCSQKQLNHSLKTKLNSLYSTVWTKWISKNLTKKICNILKNLDTLNLIYSEDILLTKLCLDTCTNMRYLNKTLYRYYAWKSPLYLHEKFFNADQFFRYIKLIEIDIDNQYKNNTYKYFIPNNLPSINSILEEKLSNNGNYYLYVAVYKLFYDSLENQELYLRELFNRFDKTILYELYTTIGKFHNTKLDDKLVKSMKFKIKI